MITKYIHHGQLVFVDSELQGKHREHCLCFKCDVFKPNTPENCPIAQATFENCVRFNTTTPMYECPNYTAPTCQSRELTGRIDAVQGILCVETEDPCGKPASVQIDSAASPTGKKWLCTEHNDRLEKFKASLRAAREEAK